MYLPALGVVIVSFNGADFIFDCLESLWASQGVQLSIVVVENGSTDGSAEKIRDWAAGRMDWSAPVDMPFACVPSRKPLPLTDSAPGTPVDWSQPAEGHRLMLLDVGENTGFAGGVNRGLEVLATQVGLDRFWVLNPDSAVPPDTARAFATQPVPTGGFALMGGRVLYFHQPDTIQIDGGLINRRTGIAGNINLFAKHAETPPADPADFAFIMGANMVVSREFYETVGPMVEDYFLYYEEVDWALRRGNQALAYCPDGILYHRAGASIGSPTLDRPASPFSLYFKHRARLMFVRRFFPSSVLTSHSYTLAKAGQYLIRGW